jgi:hypothetical protein
MYVLNLISNLNADYATHCEEELYENILTINDCLADPAVAAMAGGNWEVVWGPAIANTAHKRSYLPLQKITRWITDNALYIAQKQGTDEYFIGIAGTNAFSSVGWFEQDFDVTTCVAWPPTYLHIKNPEVEGAPYVSTGSNAGLKALVELRPQKNAKAAGITFLDFLLKEVKGKECSISIGGHSLGGCLTPLVAAAIGDKMKDAPNANQYRGVEINAYPTAGPTPGNEDFADHLQGHINEYHAVFNAHDIVPQAWDAKGLDDLMKAYGTWLFGDGVIKPNSQINYTFADWIANYAKTQNYVRLPKNPNSKFKVTTWEGDLIEEVTVDDTVITSMDFAAYITGLSIGLQITPAGAELKKLVQLNTQESSKLPLEDTATELLRPVNKLLYKYTPRIFSKYYHRFFFNKFINDFVRYAMQVALQHTVAYNNPRSSKGRVPWEFSATERATLQKYVTSVKHRFLCKANDIEWQAATGVDLVTKLATLITDWAEENPLEASALVKEHFRHIEEQNNSNQTDEELRELEKLTLHFNREIDTVLQMVRKIYYL